jgi:hypothetical protein
MAGGSHTERRTAGRLESGNVLPGPLRHPRKPPRRDPSCPGSIFASLRGPAST